MKIMFASDIHGSAFYCEKILENYKKENAEKLILLGDILYHGPRNDLPEGYCPKEVTKMLNEQKKNILAVRGNCDADIDNMVLEFNILADYMIMYYEKRMFFITHGHLYNEDSLPMLNAGDILIHGHTHLKIAENKGDYIYINPGSASLPKDDDIRSYMIFEDGVFSIKDMDGNTVKEYDIR